ncbi:phosphoribosylamine--glycine ligase [Helicobacter muridarum]|uniref:Phosphoribosylamine--glycine ligase n=2 Tax=Helicobacter muridarum TaxID=216 RepID=A0A099TYZ9_9HELI|nr:phosphoribosylamine--glycine ligase [Helicobacter muridarum]TLD98500.1 phosphoribosylamine--glycine ligase [Helicobacter muridarum]STQ86796.1 phosphoribosylamine--glycine ligase [Helicobacter muridarum]
MQTNTNILIIGNGGREYALARSLRYDRRVKDIFFSPENPGASMYLNAKHFNYRTNEELLNNIKQHNISLVIIGPEEPLIRGLSDFLESSGVNVFGPSSSNARLEGSKAYMKQLISKLNIPTARYIEISLDNIQEGYRFIESLSLPIVIKASGLCAGKGVLILDSKQEAKLSLDKMLSGELFGESGKVVVIEEFLDGYELSVFALSNGREYVVLPACQDHKRLLDSNKGPNTGGMGAYSNLPSNLYNEELESKIKDRILTPTFDMLRGLGTPYKGVIFAGIMVVSNEPYLLEYNVRFGDPECEVLIPLLETPLLDILQSCAKGENINYIKFRDLCSVCVVMTSSDYTKSEKSNSYPAKIHLSDSIKEQLTNNLESSSSKSHIIFANTTNKDGDLYANSGRAIVAVGIGQTLQEARNSAYQLVDGVTFDGKHCRKDIAYQAL